MFKKLFLVAILIISTHSSKAEIATGTGFFVSNNGYLITNAHVIEGASGVTVKDNAGGIFEASVISVDEHNDLALLKINTSTNALNVGSSLDVDKGDKVYTLGFPDPSIQGLEAKYTEGVISSFSGVVGMPNTYQITTPIQGGNSGGPLINEKGMVVGVIVSKLVDVKKENVSYAIKSDYIIPLLRNVPRSNRSSVTKVRSVSEIERSVVLVISKLKSSEPNKTKTVIAGVDTPAAPNVPHENSRLNYSATVQGPDIAEQGCVVPIGVKFDPAIREGTTFNVMSGKDVAAKVLVERGQLSELQMRVRMTGSNSLSVECTTCSVIPKPVQVKNSCAPDSTPQGNGGIRLRLKDAKVMTLIEGHYPGGVIRLKTSQASIAVSTTSMTARNPFFGFSKFAESSGACIQISSSALNLNVENCTK